MTLSRRLACIALVAWPRCSAPPPELDDLGPLPPFALTDETGHAVTDQSLHGTVWAANFLFTSCPTECPPLARASSKLAQQLGANASDNVAVISISVDPMTDTPEILTAFKRRYPPEESKIERPAPKPWHLLTGDYPAMERLVVQGFMQPILRADKVFGTPSDVTAVQQPTPLDTAHSLRFVVVDQRGHIRAMYGREMPELARMAHAMHWLAAHPPEDL